MIGKLLRIRYEINQSLSEGPIFKSFVAHDRVAAKDVCIRTFQPPFDTEKKFIAAVGEVIKNQADVKHPGVERIFELDDDDGTPFLIGEYSPGTPLTERIKRFAPFSVPVAVGMSVSIAEALAALHRDSIVHGDPGAHNIVVSPDGDCRVQLAGIWKAYSASQTAGVVVLPSMAPYLAPEISQGAMPSPSSDVYALGAVLFQLLTGRPPYMAEQPVALVMKHASEPVPSPKSLNASIPNALDETVRKAMAKAPEDRYKDADAMLTDLRAVQDALRFGKSVGWPPKGVAAKAQEPVAPQLSGMKTEKEERRARSRAADQFEEESVPGDVPTWLRMVLVFFVSLVVFMVGGWMIFNLNKPRSIAVPDIRRLSLTEGESRLKALNLKMHIIRRQVSDQQADTILDTDPSPGRAVVEGQAVGVVLSEGTRYVEVPDVRGVTPDKAREMLDTIGLKLSDRIIEERDRSAEPGTIVSQLPEKGQRVERGSAIRIRVASDSSKTSSGDAEANKKYLYTIKIELTDIQDSVSLRVDMTDSRSTKTIHEEQHDPGDEITLTAEGYGPEADFRIFYDGELVKQVTKKADEKQEQP